LEEREELTARHAAQHDLHVVHAYADRPTMAGQRRVALKLFQDAASSSPADLRGRR
jgi:threonine dehydratase